VAECREHPVDELGPVRVLVGDPDPTCILGGALCDLPKTEEQRGVGEVERRCPGLTSCPEAPFGVLGEEVEDRLDPCFPVAASGAGVADEQGLHGRSAGEGTEEADADPDALHPGLPAVADAAADGRGRPDVDAGSSDDRVGDPARRGGTVVGRATNRIRQQRPRLVHRGHPPLPIEVRPSVDTDEIGVELPGETPVRSPEHHEVGVPGDAEAGVGVLVGLSRGHGGSVGGVRAGRGPGPSVDVVVEVVDLVEPVGDPGRWAGAPAFAVPSDARDPAVLHVVELGPEVEVAPVSRFRQLTGSDGAPDRAAGFVPVGAVPEPAPRRKGDDVGERLGEPLDGIPHAQRTETGRVDDRTPFGAGEEPADGCGVSPSTVSCPDVAHVLEVAADERVREGRLPRTRLTEERERPGGQEETVDVVEAGTGPDRGDHDGGSTGERGEVVEDGAELLDARGVGLGEDHAGGSTTLVHEDQEPLDPPEAHGSVQAEHASDHVDVRCDDLRVGVLTGVAADHDASARRERHDGSGPVDLFDGGPVADDGRAIQAGGPVSGERSVREDVTVRCPDRVEASGRRADPADGSAGGEVRRCELLDLVVPADPDEGGVGGGAHRGAPTRYVNLA